MEAKNLTDLLNDLKFEKLNDNPEGMTFETVDPNPFVLTDEDEWAAAVAKATDKQTELFDWFLVSMTLKNIDLGTHVLASFEGGEFTTSQIVHLAPDMSAVVTRSGSLYKLRQPGEGIPTPSQTLFWVYSLRYWGFGRVVADWPEVFF